ncbi:MULTISPECIES: MetQ/NlpA family ABC transporter substrate-binding protein [Acinetobacter]|uniref:MetQ/NlpA family ABC transporter substrate-binding protein n=1 Tax=Acinetobacter TaxID=469 RepID=UPI0015D257A5|nr:MULTISPECIES: MetQ/NlpA family ABC transporter substrate-binding protein [Acinetobacter]WKT74298.1 MetQ/NlpA family ABC transporter substrate-binding protein [Acinetobacter variabilis]
MTQVNSSNSNAKKWIIGGVILALILGLAAYRWTKGQQQEDVLTIGISPPYADLLQSVADELKPQGINVKLVEFSDWHAPNVAVQNGDIDANFFQQSVYLRNAIRETNFDLHSFASGTGSHVGLYSRKYKSLDELPQNARVVIPNDPVNLARALILLNRAKLIELKDINNELSTVKDIKNNPKQLQFIEVEGPQTAHALNEADLIFGYPHYLKLAKAADPHDALFLDPIDKKYAILFVTRKDYEDKNQKLATFVKAFQSSAKVKAILDQDFGTGMWFEGWK